MSLKDNIDKLLDDWAWGLLEGEFVTKASLASLKARIKELLDAQK